MNRFLKRIISTLVIMVSLTSMSAGVYAGNYDNIKITKKDMEKIAQEKQVIKDIASGESTLVGGGHKFHFVLEQEQAAPGDVTVQWASGGIDHTHQFITANALTILENDKGWNVVKYLYTPYSDNGAGIITEYADEPDESETDSSTFIGHFYDPYTGTNYLNTGEITAMTRFKQHTASAIGSYWTNRTYSLQQLGMAIHYLSDMNEPHHAANYIAGLTNHSDYETWVDTRRSNYSVSSGADYSNGQASFYDYYVDLAETCAINAYNNRDDASAPDEFSWSNATYETLPYAQKAVAAFIYHFLIAVGENVGA